MNTVPPQGKVKKISFFIRSHKLISIIGLLIIAGVSWKAWGGNGSGTETRYILGTVTRGTIVASVSGTGQVSASLQIDLKTKAGGDIVYLPIIAGQNISTGEILLSIDARDAQKAVRDAEVNLESAKLTLAKLKKPADELALTQSTNAVSKAAETKSSAENSLVKAYDDAFTAIANSFLDLPTISTGLHDILRTSSPGLASSGEWNIEAYTAATLKYDDRIRAFHDDTELRYAAMQKLYDNVHAKYKGITRASNATTTEAMVEETVRLGKEMGETVKSASNLIQFYKDRLKERNQQVASITDTHLALLGDYTGKINGRLSTLLTVQTAIKSTRDAIASAERSTIENDQSLQKLRAGADSLDIASAELTVRQRENALADARERLADYVVRAPFAGTLAKINVKKSDSVSAGTLVATLITTQKLAEISLNEVDAAKVKLGQKVTLTFDALPDVTLTGVVSELDTVGTIAQGVVTYTAKMAFDIQDKRIKPGMSVSAAIISAVAQDVLTVTGSAVKSQGITHYVEILDTPGSDAANTRGVLSPQPPRRQSVEIGLMSDGGTEIISGLSEGDLIVVRTVTPQKVASSQQTPSLFGGVGGNRGGGGAGGGRSFGR